MAMRMLYVGQTAAGGTCHDRMRALESLGVEIVAFDVGPFMQMPRLMGSIATRLNVGPALGRLNRELCAFSKGLEGITHVWVDKGKWIYPETLREMRRRLGAKLIHYTPDPQLVFHKSRHFRRSVPLYDLLFTTKPFEMGLYQQAGARKLVLTYQAYEATRFYPRPPTEEYASDVTLIGHYEGHYAEQARVATRSGARVKVWGPHWRRKTQGQEWAREVVQGDGVWRDEYPKALCSAKIALGLLSKLIPETTTTRTFEIPACGVFMLAERTREHEELFAEGKEAEFFSTEGEMVDKLRYYLEHAEERQRIATAGRRRCETSGYSNHDRLREMLARVQELGN